MPHSTVLLRVYVPSNVMSLSRSSTAFRQPPSCARSTSTATVDTSTTSRGTILVPSIVGLLLLLLCSSFLGDPDTPAPPHNQHHRRPTKQPASQISATVNERKIAARDLQNSRRRQRTR